jgi:hypothetical protein
VALEVGGSGGGSGGWHRAHERRWRSKAMRKDLHGIDEFFLGMIDVENYWRWMVFWEKIGGFHGDIPLFLNAERGIAGDSLRLENSITCLWGSINDRCMCSINKIGFKIITPHKFINKLALRESFMNPTDSSKLIIYRRLFSLISR